MYDDGVVVPVEGTGFRVYGPGAFTRAPALSIGNVIAGGIVKDPIAGRLFNWLILACILVTFCVFAPVWLIIIVYCYFTHRTGTLQVWDLLKSMAFGKP